MNTFFTSMTVNPYTDTILVLEVSYINDDGVDLAAKILYNATDCWHNSQVVKMMGQDELGYYLLAFDAKYVEWLFRCELGDKFNIDYFNYTWHEVPSWQMTIVENKMPMFLMDENYVYREGFLTYPQIAFALLISDNMLNEYDLLRRLYVDGEDIPCPWEYASDEDLGKAVRKWAEDHVREDWRNVYAI